MSDRGSFEDFYETQYGPVARLAAALVGRWDVADELVQDAFIALFRNWERVSRYDSPEAWLRRVVLNRSLSALRRRAAEARLIARLAARRIEHTDNDMRDSAVWREVARLPKRQAQVIALVFLEDRSVSDVAAILGTAEDTVRTHLRRARHTLAARLRTTTEDEQ